MIVRAKTMTQWMKFNLKDYIEDIATLGADAGYPGLTYYTDTVKLYNKFHDEIWEALYEDANDFGHDNIFSLIASFGRNEASTDDQFKNLLVWYLAERIARQLTDKE